MDKEKKISLLEWSASITLIGSFVLGIMSVSSPQLIGRYWFLVGVGIFWGLMGWLSKVKRDTKKDIRFTNIRK